MRVRERAMREGDEGIGSDDGGMGRESRDDKGKGKDEK
jgi:hypothetical protein